MVDDAKLHQFIGQILSDLGGAASVALVRIGDALGLYKTLHARGPMGMEGLTTYKYKLRGSGQTVGDYKSGKKFTHKLL